MEQNSNLQRLLSVRAAGFALALALTAGLWPGAALAALVPESPQGDIVAVTIQKVKLKSTYVETFSLTGSVHKATYKTSTKKVYRKVNGTGLYAATLTKYAGKSTKYNAEVASTVTFLDKRIDTWDDMPHANVTAISAKAFKGCKAKTLSIYTRFLTKSGVKNSLKGSKITTVQVPKSCLKKYKTYFTEKNCGKSVKVKAFTGKLKNWPAGNETPTNAHADNAWIWLATKDLDEIDEV